MQTLRTDLMIWSIVNTLSPQLQIDFQPIFIRVANVQFTVNACCDFTSQCIIVRINHSFYSPKSSKIYRCWIVWGQNIRVVIIPSFLAITALGQTIYYLYLLSRFQFIASSYLASVCCPWYSGPFVYNRFGRIHGGEYLW